MFGWPGRARTRDIFVNSEALYQLSYWPMEFGAHVQIRTAFYRSTKPDFTVKVSWAWLNLVGHQGNDPCSTG